MRDLLGRLCLWALLALVVLAVLLIVVDQFFSDGDPSTFVYDGF